MAPSGVLIIGFAFVFRHLVQRRLGRLPVVPSIFAGAALSAYVAPPSQVLASRVAFLLSEFADFAVYTPLQEKKFIAAVILSSIVGSVVDSAVFLILGFRKP